MMVTRRSAALGSAALLLALALAGCAGNGTGTAAPGPSDVIDLPSVSASAEPTTEPSGAKPTASGAETISGTVIAGVEPNCLVLQDAKGSHLLVFDDKALRAEAPVGAKVTLTGTSKPAMMSTCQQGVPFIVTSVKAG
jgi:surface antigen